MLGLGDSSVSVLGILGHLIIGVEVTVTPSNVLAIPEACRSNAATVGTMDADFCP